jgi:hypothetical protein
MISQVADSLPKPAPQQKPRPVTPEIIDIEKEYNEELRKNRKAYEKKIKGGNQKTQIDDLQLEEEEEIDRHKNKKPIPRIRKNEGNYEENEELFNDPTPDDDVLSRKPITRDSDSKSRTSDVMSKAKELAKLRENSNPSPPPGHPSNVKM